MSNLINFMKWTLVQKLFFSPTEKKFVHSIKVLDVVGKKGINIIPPFSFSNARKLETYTPLTTGNRVSAHSPTGKTLFPGHKSN